MKVLVLGGAGMFGHVAFQVFNKEFETYATFRKVEKKIIDSGIFPEKKIIYGIDAYSFHTISKMLDEYRPNVVINCIGVIKQLKESKNPRSVIYINALFPHLLAEECISKNIRLIHISTDCVFSGSKGDYIEEDFSDALDLYGRTKYLGEVAGENILTVRTSIVGSELFSKVSLFDWFLSLEDEEVSGYTQAIYTGLTTKRLAEELLSIVGTHKHLNGLYQISSEKISKYELLLKLKEVFKRPTRINIDYKFKCDRSLNSKKYQESTGFNPPKWDSMIEQFSLDYQKYHKGK